MQPFLRVIELMEGSSVYIEEGILKKMRSEVKSGTEFAIRLMECYWDQQRLRMLTLALDPRIMKAIEGVFLAIVSKEGEV